jgi:hypothetical protein
MARANDEQEVVKQWQKVNGGQARQQKEAESSTTSDDTHS